MDTPLKINGWNLKITQLKGKSSSKPSLFWVPGCIYEYLFCKTWTCFQVRLNNLNSSISPNPMVDQFINVRDMNMDYHNDKRFWSTISQLDTLSSNKNCRNMKLSNNVKFYITCAYDMMYGINRKYYKMLILQGILN